MKGCLKQRSTGLEFIVIIIIIWRRNAASAWQVQQESFTAVCHLQPLFEIPYPHWNMLPDAKHHKSKVCHETLYGNEQLPLPHIN